MERIEADLSTGPAASFAGLRRAVGALAESGADMSAVAARYPTEWTVLTAPSPQAYAALADVAISASERRLHRESEQTFRVLQAAATALCQGSQSADRSLVLSGAGRSDLATLRGLIRALEYQRATGIGRLIVPIEDALVVNAPAGPDADYRTERARCLCLMGFDVSRDDLVVKDLPDAGPASPTADLFHAATTGTGSASDRIAAAVAYCRAAFYEGNWEGMAIVAAACLPLAGSLTAAQVAALGDTADTDRVHAIEFEPALMRHPGDVRAHLLKVLGIQATFRGEQGRAIDYFRAMRDADGPLSPEATAQSHLYTALTLTKRQRQLDAAVGELDAGFAAVAPTPDEAPSVRRERGWLHNLRGLVFYREHDALAAFNQEKLALACLEGLLDDSSVHLRVNLVSNISVLQESAGRVPQSLRTWERFSNTGFQADTKFVKHHRYRAGGLLLKIGDRDAATAALHESLASCVNLADDFHECEIATELGTLALDGDRASATRHFDQAHTAATRLGDPYRMARAAAGGALARGDRPEPAQASLALRSTTHTEMAAALARVVTGDVRAALPMPRTKLNRPFDLVNF
jgi:hypothetical protein